MSGGNAEPASPAPSETTGRRRDHTLDGFRGWAALMVVSFHMTWELFGASFPIFRNPVTASLLDGGLAVSIFFVLSGQALSLSFFRTGRIGGTLDLALKRHPRLSIPVFVSTATVVAILALGLDFNREAGALVGRPDWLGSWLSFPAGIDRLIAFSLVDVYVLDTRHAAISLNPMLWTMKVELLGSIVVFLALGLWSMNRVLGRGLVIGAFVFCAVVGLRGGEFLGFVACFLFGLLSAHAETNGFLAALRRRLPDGAVLATLVAVMALDGFAHTGMLAGERGKIYAFAFGIAVVFLVGVSRTARAVMNADLSQWLGRVSFPLFLMQFPVLVSFGSWLVVLAGRHSALDLGAAAAIAAASIAAALAAAACFAPVDVLTKRICDGLVGVVRGAVASARRG